MQKLGLLTAAAVLATALGFGGAAQAQITLPFDDDLIVYYSFDDEADPTNDDSSNGHDGDLQNGPVFVTGAADKAPLSPNAAALDFDGNNDLVDVPNGATVKTLSQVTLSVWFNVETLPNSLQYIYHESAPSSAASARLLLRIDTDNMLHFGGRTLDANAFTVWVDSPTALSTGAWTHVAAVFNADTDVHKLYINGVVQTNFLAESPFENVDPDDIKIGNYGGGQPVEFNGILDDVRVYDRELTAREIEQLASGITITKELLSTVNLDDGGDTTLDLNEDWQFVMKVTVTNNSSSTLTNLELIDGLPGDLELGNDTSRLKNDFGDECPDDKLLGEGDNTGGSAPTAFATGNSAKCHVTWDMGSLAPGDSAMLTMNTSTDVNPRGLRRGPEADFQEYTSDGPYCINQGGTLIDTVQEIVLGRSNGLQVNNGTIINETSATINNAGFEVASPAEGALDAPGVPQWLGNIGTGTLNPDDAIHFTDEAPEGDNVAVVAANLAAGGFLAQILSETLTAGKTYTLEMEVGDAIDIDFPGYEVALVAGLSFPPNIIASADETDVDPGEDNFDPVTVEFFASAIDPNLGETLSILLLSDDIATFFDDVSLTITMPVVDMVEPEVCGEPII